jgi:hypothetical protein
LAKRRFSPTKRRGAGGGGVCVCVTTLGIRLTPSMGEVDGVRVHNPSPRVGAPWFGWSLRICARVCLLLHVKQALLCALCSEPFQLPPLDRTPHGLSCGKCVCGHCLAFYFAPWKTFCPFDGHPIDRGHAGAPLHTPTIVALLRKSVAASSRPSEAGVVGTDGAPTGATAADAALTGAPGVVAGQPPGAVDASLGHAVLRDASSGLVPTGWAADAADPPSSSTSGPEGTGASVVAGAGGGVAGDAELSGDRNSGGIGVGGAGGAAGSGGGDRGGGEGGRTVGLLEGGGEDAAGSVGMVPHPGHPMAMVRLMELLKASKESVTSAAGSSGAPPLLHVALPRGDPSDVALADSAVGGGGGTGAAATTAVGTVSSSPDAAATGVAETGESPRGGLAVLRPPAAGADVAGKQKASPGLHMPAMAHAPLTSLSAAVSLSGLGLESFVVGAWLDNAIHVDMVAPLLPTSLGVLSFTVGAVGADPVSVTTREGEAEVRSEDGSLCARVVKVSPERTSCIFSIDTVSGGSVEAVAWCVQWSGAGTLPCKGVATVAPWEPGNPRGRPVQVLPTSGRSFSVCTTLDDGLVVVSLHDQHVLVVFDAASGALVRVLGGGAGDTPDGSAGAGCPRDGPGRFMHPACVCPVLPSVLEANAPAEVLVCDYGNNRVQRLTVEGRHVMTLGSGVVAGPWGVAANDEVIVVSELSASRIAVFGVKDGALVRVFGAPGTASGRLCQPRGLRIAKDNRHVVVAEEGSSRLSVFTLKGRYVKHIGEEIVSKPLDLELEHRSGTVLVPDRGNGRVCRFKDGRFLASWSVAPPLSGEGAALGVAVSPRHTAPSSCTFAGGGKLFVVDAAVADCVVFV